MGAVKVGGYGDLFLDTTVVCSNPDIIGRLKLVEGSSHCGTDRQSVEEARDMAIRECLFHAKTAGGSASNALKVIAQLGQHDVTLYTLSVDDEDGRTAKARLNKLGIKLLNVESDEVQPTDKTGICISFVTTVKGIVERTMLTFQDIADKFKANCLKEDYFKDKQFSIHDGYNIYHDKMFETAFKYAKANDCQTVMGLPSPKTVADFKNKLIFYSGRSDFCFGNMEEFQALTKNDRPGDILSFYDVDQTVVITDGANGSYVKWKGTLAMHHFEALPVPKVVDTTGAGDFFMGGVMTGVMADKSMEECIQLGNLAASYVIQEYGADLPDEKWDELKERARHILVPNVDAQLVSVNSLI